MPLQTARLGERRTNPLTPIQRILALAIVGVYLSLTLALAFTARPLNDEAAYANPAYNLLHNGSLGMTLYPLPDYLPVSLAKHIYIQPPLYFVMTAALFRIAGFGLVQVRLLSIFFGLICLLAWFTITRSLTKSVDAALLVIGLISVDYFFLFGAAHGRMEIVCVGLGSAGIALYIYLRQTHLMRAVFCGNLLAGLAMLTHPVGLVWAAGTLLAMLFLDWRMLSINLLSIGLAPYLLVGAAWGSFIAQDPAAFRDQMKAVLIVNEGSFDYSHLSHVRFIAYLQQEVLTRYAAPYGFLPGVGLASRLKVLVLTAYMIGVFGILFFRKLRAQPFVVWFSATFIASFFILAEISPSKFNYYLPHTTVVMAACLGIFLFSVSDSPRWKPILAVVAILAMIQVAGVSRVILQDEYRKTYAPVIDALKRNTPRDSLIMSQCELWFGLWQDHTILNDNRLGLHSGLHPAAFVMDSVFRDLHERDRRADPEAYRHVEDLIGRSHSIYKDAYSEVYLTDPQFEGIPK